MGDFLLGQRKGPLQFLVTCTTRLIDPDFSSELVVRLPFCIAGILAVYFFYKLVRLHFGEKPGIYAALFMATNGLFVAFSRITQYQSFTVLFTVLTLYALSLALVDEKWRFQGLYWGAVSAAICLLAHFDGGFVLPPAAYLLFLWLRKGGAQIKSWKLWKPVIMAGGIFALLVGAFYLPYALKLSEYQLGYWEERITGATSDSIGLFKLYNPTIVIFIYLILIILSLFQFSREEKYVLLWIWFLPPLIFMEMVMTDPRTHFYTYLIPLTIFAGLGLSTFENLLKRWFHRFGALMGYGVNLILFVFLALLSHTIFIQHPPEYPWQTKSFLVWKFQPQAYEGMMGFPYSRHWREIGKFLQNNQGDNPAWYISNEKVAIAGFYLPENIQFYDVESKKPPKIAPDEKIFAIVVEHPQSWLTEFLGQPADTWKSQHTPIASFKGEQMELLAEVYAIDPSQLGNIKP